MFGRILQKNCTRVPLSQLMDCIESHLRDMYSGGFLTKQNSYAINLLGCKLVDPESFKPCAACFWHKGTRH